MAHRVKRIVIECRVPQGQYCRVLFNTTLGYLRAPNRFLPGRRQTRLIPYSQKLLLPIVSLVYKFKKKNERRRHSVHMVARGASGYVISGAPAAAPVVAFLP